MSLGACVSHPTIGVAFPLTNQDLPSGQESLGRVKRKIISSELSSQNQLFTEVKRSGKRWPKIDMNSKCQGETSL